MRRGGRDATGPSEGRPGRWWLLGDHELVLDEDVAAAWIERFLWEGTTVPLGSAFADARTHFFLFFFGTRGGKRRDSKP